MGYMLIVVGVFFSALGILIYRGILTDSIAGYDEKKDDPIKASKWVGSNLICLGLVKLTSGIITIVCNLNELMAMTFLFIPVIIFCLRITVLYNKKVRR